MPKIGDLFVQIGADVGALSRELKAAGKEFEHFGRDIAKTGLELSKVLTVPLAGFSAAAIASSKTASDAFKAFGERTKTIMGQIGTDLFHALHFDDLHEQLENALKGAADIFHNLDSSMQTLIATTLGVTAAAGPMLIVIGEIVRAIGATQKAIVFLVSTVSAHPLIALGTVLAALAVGLGMTALAARGASVETKGYVDETEEAAIRVSIAEDKLRRIRERRLDLEKKLAQVRSEGPKAALFPAGISPIVAQMASVQKLEDQIAGLGEKEAENELVTARLAKATKDYKDALNLANAEAAHGGTEEEFQKNRLEALVKLRKELLTQYAAEAEARKKAEDPASIATLDDAMGKLDAKIADVNTQIEGTKERIDKLTDPHSIEGIYQFWNTWKTSFEWIRNQALSIADAFKTAWADALVQTLVYGGSFRTAMAGVFQAVATQGIKVAVESLFQIIQMFISQIVTGSIAAYSYIPFVGLALGIAAAGAGIAAAKALSKKHGGHSFAKGAYVGGPTLAVVGDAPRGEVIVPYDRWMQENRRDATGDGRPLHAHFYVDGREMAEAILPHWPGALRYHGAA